MIDERAVIDPSAKIGQDVKIGPFSVIGADVEIGDGCEIGPHVVINGPTILGRENRIFQFASVGEAPQDKKFAGEKTRLEVGDRNIIREYCTLHRGTPGDQSLTKIGSDNLFMAYTHVAHDCVVGDNTIFANAASIAGHVDVGDFAILGGFTNVHQFCNIGAHSFCGLGSTILRDIPPYVIANGNPAEPHGINIEGLKRRGFSKEQIQAIRRAYKVLYKSGLKLQEAIEEIRKSAKGVEEIELFAAFLENSQRSIAR